MKTKILMLSAAFALMSTGAFAQGNADACGNAYGPCMDKCAGQPASLQPACSNSCEATTNACYSKMFSSSSQGSTPEEAAAAAGQAQATPEPETEARAAKDEAKPQSKKKKKKSS